MINLPQGFASQFNSARSDKEMRLKDEAEYLEGHIKKAAAARKLKVEKYMEQVDQGSLRSVLIDAAICGLSLNPHGKLAYAIPRWNSAEGQVEYSYSPSYLGFQQAALSSGAIQMITTELVYEKDKFTYGSTHEGPVYSFAMARGDRGNLEGVFVYARFNNGGGHLEWMPMADIEGVQEAATRASKGRTPPTWTGPFRFEMYKKAAVRRAAKHWPRNPILTQLEENMSRVDPVAFDEQEVPEEPAEETCTPEQIEEVIQWAVEDLELPEGHAPMWTRRTIEALGYEDHTDLPVSRVQEVKDRMTKRKERIAAATQ